MFNLYRFVSEMKEEFLDLENRFDGIDSQINIDVAKLHPYLPTLGIVFRHFTTVFRRISPILNLVLRNNWIFSRLKDQFPVEITAIL